MSQCPLDDTNLQDWITVGKCALRSAIIAVFCSLWRWPWSFCNKACQCLMFKLWLDIYRVQELYVYIGALLLCGNLYVVPRPEMFAPADRSA